MDESIRWKWHVEPLSRRHERTGFDCGEASLNEFILKRAGQFDRKGLGRTHVAVRPGETRIEGYYTLACGSVTYESLPDNQGKGLPQSMDLPTILLGRLAVDRSVQEQGLGAFLLLNALYRSRDAAGSVGALAIVTEALHDRARTFYLKFGFLSLKDDPRHLYLPIKRIPEPPREGCR